MSECTFFGDFKNSVLEEYEYLMIIFLDFIYSVLKILKL